MMKVLLILIILPVLMLIGKYMEYTGLSKILWVVLLIGALIAIRVSFDRREDEKLELKKREEEAKRLAEEEELLRKRLIERLSPQASNGPSEDQLRGLLEKLEPDALDDVIPPHGVLTILFTDIVDSTRTKSEVGDKSYYEVLKRHNVLLRECFIRHKGRELKSIGDAFLCVFVDPAQAVACATEIQRGLSDFPIQVAGKSLQVRIGLHTGIPIPFLDRNTGKSDLSGSDVDKASRVEAMAVGGQVLISEETRALAKPKEVYDWGPWELKGLGSHRIFEVLWDGKSPIEPAGKRSGESDNEILEGARRILARSKERIEQ